MTKFSELEDLKTYFTAAEEAVEEYKKTLEAEEAGKSVTKAALKRMRKLMDTCASVKVTAKKETLNF